jgi:hypothetical protein
VERVSTRFRAEAGERRLGAMPLYIDHHKNLEGLTAEAVAEDHKKDLEVQDQHGAKALKTR